MAFRGQPVGIDWPGNGDVQGFGDFRKALGVGGVFREQGLDPGGPQLVQRGGQLGGVAFVFTAYSLDADAAEAEFPAEILAEVGRILLAECAAGVKAAAGTKLSRASVTAV